MKRMIVNKYGGPESLILEECDSPIIKELSVRIKVENVGVNFADTLVLEEDIKRDLGLHFRQA